MVGTYSSFYKTKGKILKQKLINILEYFINMSHWNYSYQMSDQSNRNFFIRAFLSFGPEPTDADAFWLP